MPRSQVPAYLRDAVQRESLAAELHTLADGIDRTEPEDGAPRPSRLDLARAARIRTWATETEEYPRAD